MAFLAFLTLELQTKEKTGLILPNDPNDTKKILKIGISYILAFHLTFATFIGLFQFFLRSLKFKKSSGMQ